MRLELVRYVLTAAIRDRFVIALLLGLIVSTSLSVFFASSSVTEQDQFTLVFTGGGLRVLGATGLVLFTVFFVRRCFEARDIEFLLARPISRTQLILSYSMAFSLMALTLGLVQGMCLYAIGQQYFGIGGMMWTASLIVENIIIVNVAFFFALVLSSAVSGAMATLGFYVLARMMGQILGIIDVGSAGGYKTLKLIMQVISSVIPRLDLMGQSSWLLYGPPEQGGDWSFIVVQLISFVFLITIASLIDFLRREF